MMSHPFFLSQMNFTPNITIEYESKDFAIWRAHVASYSSQSPLCLIRLEIIMFVQAKRRFNMMP